MRPDQFFSQKNNELSALVRKAVEMCSADAAKLTTGLADDKPITIHCGGRDEEWQSRYLAYHYYYTGAVSCEGSESDRYWKIVADLLLGKEKPTDEDDWRSVA